MTSHKNLPGSGELDYNAMMRNALIGVVRDILDDAAKHGLRGEHHYYIAFNTTHPGVRIPGYLKAQHPKDMTIVLQNQFWDLETDDDGFSVRLSFKSKPELLVIPFDALLGFLDPSVQFGLQFKDGSTDAAEQAPEDETEGSAERLDTEQDENVVALDAFRKQ